MIHFILCEFHLNKLFFKGELCYVKFTSKNENKRKYLHLFPLNRVQYYAHLGNRPQAKYIK